MSYSPIGSTASKYPKSLFNKIFVIENRTIGHVARDTGHTIVVFSESHNGRYDIPKSEIISTGGSITLSDASTLENYKQDKDSPLPEHEESLRASAEQIRGAARALVYEKKMTGNNQREVTPDAIIRERQELEVEPRSATRTVSTPIGYSEKPESQIVRQLKRGAKEFKELVRACSRIAAKKAKEKKRQTGEKLAQMDAEKIGNLGILAGQFTSDFDRILDQIRARPPAQQRDIYGGLITLIDFQRPLVVARRDMAARLAPSLGKKSSEQITGLKKIRRQRNRIRSTEMKRLS